MLRIQTAATNKRRLKQTFVRIDSSTGPASAEDMCWALSDGATGGRASRRFLHDEMSCERNMPAREKLGPGERRPAACTRT